MGGVSTVWGRRSISQPRHIRLAARDALSTAVSVAEESILSTAFRTAYTPIPDTAYEQQDVPPQAGIFHLFASEEDQQVA